MTAPPEHGVDIDVVSQLVQRVAADVIVPRFRALGPGEVFAKGVDDVVTAADLEAETLIAAGLSELLPGVAVIGEETVAADPSLLARALTEERYWLLDPVDGTANFVAGHEDFGVMLALVERGETVASWIWLPIHEALYTATRGAGAHRNGVRLVPPRSAQPKAAADSTGWVSTKYLPPDIADHVTSGRSRFASVSHGPGAAAVMYARLAEHEIDFALFWRLNPWDHAPGALLVAEAGGAARRVDGSTYRPSRTGTGLLITADAAAWSSVRQTLLDNHFPR